MGGWNIRSLQQVDENNELANLREMDWMEEGSSLFTIDPSILSLALDSHSPTLIGRSMLKIYIGITNLLTSLLVALHLPSSTPARKKNGSFSHGSKVFNSMPLTVVPSDKRCGSASRKPSNTGNPSGSLLVVPFRISDHRFPAFGCYGLPLECCSTATRCNSMFQHLPSTCL